ncbi:hypothetical protein V7122_20230 [Bacillus sp. JJ1532]
MKEQQRENEITHVEAENEKQLIREFTNPESKQPVPQPKDFEDIEY